MSISAPPPSVPGRSATRVDRWILGLHILAAFGFGVVGLLAATDPGWGDLQRLLTVMVVGMWGLGIFLTWMIARRLGSQWVRSAVMIVGPFALLLVGFALTQAT